MSIDINWFTTRVSIYCENDDVSTNGSETTGYLYIKEWS